MISAIEVAHTSATVPPKPSPKRRIAPGTLPRTNHDDLITSYYGTWTADGKAHYSNIPGNALDFTFKGPIVRWTVDSYPSKPTPDRVLYEKSGLNTNKYHTLRILVTKDRHSNSAGCYQDVSAIECEEAFDAAENDADAAFKEVETIEAGGGNPSGTERLASCPECGPSSRNWSGPP